MDRMIITADKTLRVDIWETNKGPRLGYCKYALYEWVKELGIWTKVTKDSYPSTFDMTERDALYVLAEYYLDCLRVKALEEYTLAQTAIYVRGFQDAQFMRPRKRVQPADVPHWQAGYDAYQAFKAGLQTVEVSES